MEAIARGEAAAAAASAAAALQPGPDRDAALRTAIRNTREAQEEFGKNQRRLLDGGLGLQVFDRTLPVLLMPVRLEARLAWDDGGRWIFRSPAGGAKRNLLVRIVPDQVHVDDHERGLTEQEANAAHKFRQGITGASRAAVTAAWQQLAADVGPDRAPWVARQDPAAVPRRTQGWSRQTVARLLPDRWRVSVRLRDGVASALTSPVPDQVPLTVDPLNPDPDAIAWVREFRAATAIGLAVAVPLAHLDGAPLTGPITGVTAVGGVVRLDAENAQAAFIDLIDAHHDAAGVRLAAPGDPTTSSVVGRAVTARRPEMAAEIIAAERVRGENISERSPHDPRNVGDRLARALGTDRRPWAVLPGNNARRAVDVEENLRHLAIQAFAPVLSELIPSAELRKVLENYRTRLTATGPLPVLLIRDQPYGVIPVMAQLDVQTSDATMSAVEGARRAWWEPAVERVPRLGRLGHDSISDLTALLGRDGAAHRYGMRVGVLGALTGAVAAGRAVMDPAQTLANAFGPGTTQTAPDWSRDLVELLLAPGAGPLTDPVTVVDQRASGGPQLLPSAYLRELSLAPVQALVEGTPGIPTDVRAPLLYQLARAAMLAALDEGVREALVAAGNAQDLTGWATSVSVWETEFLWTLAERGAKGVSGTTTALDLMQTQPGPALLAARAAVGRLAHADLSTLDVLTRLVLDLPTRIDPWYTATAWERLDRLRQSSDPARPGRRGLQLGGYGLLEDFLTATGPAEQSIGSYVHAPGTAHAVTAAVLHSAHRQRARDAVGLPPDRASAVRASTGMHLDAAGVRAALGLLDGLRAGRPLAELLGERIEEHLAKHGRQTLLAPLRTAYPTAAGPSAPGAVVDGLAALEAAGFPGPLHDFPIPAAAGGGLTDALGEAAAMLDALGDLLLADGVHGLVQGRLGRFAALADFTAGARVSVPEPEVVRADRKGTADQVRVLVALPSAGDAQTAWPTSVRDRSAPELALWAQTVLPDPTDVAVSFRLPAYAGQAEESRQLQLSKLLQTVGAPLDPVAEPAAFGVLDLLAFCGPGTSGPDPALATRLGALATSILGRPAVAEPGRTDGLADGDVPWVTLTGAAARLAASLAGTRPLTPADVARPASPLPAASVAELAARAEAAVNSLTSATAALTAADVGAANSATLAGLLLAAQLAGVPVAVPDEESALRTAAGAAQAESARRAAGVPTKPAAGAPADNLVSWARAALEHVCGTNQPATLALPVPDPGAANPTARAWLGQMAGVRPKVRSILHADLLAAVAGRPATVHARRSTGGPWTPAPGPAGCVDLVMLNPGTNFASPVHALAVDEWARTVPDLAADTALTFHRPTPSASPPQALLLAVPPVWLEEWTADALERHVSEAVHLARLRAVQLADLGANQLMPPTLSSAEPPGARPTGLPIDGLAPDGLMGQDPS
ncbi:hypothetical protein [Streptomyces sp. NPDC005046]